MDLVVSAGYASLPPFASVLSRPLHAPAPAPVTADRRRRSHRFGEDAERSVANYLRAGGYTVLERRVRVGGGEIDIVAVRDDTVAFVEVKARANGWDGLEAVGRTKQKRLCRARDGWIAANPAFWDFSFRFDIALVWASGRLEYLENAFDSIPSDEYAW